MNEQRWLKTILALFVAVGVTYAIVTPVFEASDELWHYPMIRHLADGNALPVQGFDPALAGPWKQEASQPPLYYYLGAALTFWIDATEMETIRWQNPHVDNGILTADGNINLVVHDPAWNPWQGTLLAVRIVRFFSVLLGAVTVYLTYRIAREVAPDRPEIALGATAVNAFLPMFLFISGAVNNDNLAIPLASLALLLMIRIVKFSHESYTLVKATNTPGVFTIENQVSVGSWLLVGIVIGLALLTKEGTFGLLPLAFGTFFIMHWQLSRNKWITAGNQNIHFWRGLLLIILRTALSFAIMLVPVLLIAGWWYWRNWQLYGDWLGWNAFIAVLGQRAHPASLAQLWQERWGFLLSFWGLFGGVNVPMWTWIYHLLNGVLVVSVLGFVVYVIRDWRLEIGKTAFNLQSLISNLLDFVAKKFALIVCLLFATAVIYGLIQWATITWSSQGRLVFTALSSLSVLLVVGLVGWLPRRPATWVLAGLGGFLFVVAAAAPWLWIRPAYQPNQFGNEASGLSDIDIRFDDQMRLVGYRIVSLSEQASVHPGDTIGVLLAWEVLSEMERDWSVFVHLTDPVLGVPIAQRDMYLDQGLRPTTLLAPGERIVNYYQLQVPETAVAPANLSLTVGLYDFYTCPDCERLSISGDENTAVLAQIPLEAIPGTYPNPVAVAYERGLELVGYELSPRQAGPGDVIDLTLYWQATRPLEDDYTFYAQVLDADTTRWGSQDLSMPTASWLTDEVQPVQFSFTLSNDTPPAVYPIIVGVYAWAEDGAIDPLQKLAPDGRPTDDLLELTLLRVNE